MRPGEVVRFDSKIVFTGKTRLVAYIRAETKGELTVDGFITFVHVDLSGKPQPHGLSIEAVTPEEIDLQEQASRL